MNHVGLHSLSISPSRADLGTLFEFADSIAVNITLRDKGPDMTQADSKFLFVSFRPETISNVL